MINSKEHRRNLYMFADRFDLIGKCKPLLERQGYILRPEDSKFYPRTPSIAYDAPWLYVQSIPEARCDLYHKVFYNTLDHIHSYCRKCWKVVIRPKTLVQLFDLYEYQKTLGVPCKCGIELRQNVFGLYGGYFYCRSQEEGQERYEQIMDFCHGTVPVLLKRYCTEFECGGMNVKGQGPSSNVPEDVTEEEREMEYYIESHFPPVPHTVSQSKHVVAATMKRWIHYAYAHGDETYKEFTNGEDLFPQYETYHIDKRRKKDGTY